MLPLPLPNPARTAYLLDLSSLARAFFSTSPPVSSANGEPIAVTVAMVHRFVDIVIDHNPGFFAVCADQPTTIGDEEDPADARFARYWRARVWPEYKGGREPPGPEYDTQIDRLLEIFSAHRVPVFRRAALEADDFFGVLVPRLARLGLQVVIISRDHDLWQLLRGNTVVAWDGASTEVTTEADVIARYGVPPVMLPVVMALSGDGDEAPGLPGIGDERAAKLVARHVPAGMTDPGAALAKILERWRWETTGKGTPSKVGIALRDGYGTALLSLTLVLLREDIDQRPDVGPISLDLSDMRLGWTWDDADRIAALGDETDIARLRTCSDKPKAPLHPDLQSLMTTEAA